MKHADESAAEMDFVTCNRRNEGFHLLQRSFLTLITE